MHLKKINCINAQQVFTPGKYVHTLQIKSRHIFKASERCENMPEHNATHVLFRAAAPNCINSQQVWKLPESFLRGGPAWRSLPVGLDLAEAVKRRAHHLMGYLRGQWAWVKMALIKMDRTCLGSCETLRGLGGGLKWNGLRTDLSAHISYHKCLFFFLIVGYYKAVNVCQDISVYVSIYVCASVCGMPWKHVLAVSRVNVRRTWGRSHYHSSYPPLLTPHGAFIPSIPWQAPTPLSLCLSLYHGKQHIATQPERDSQKKKRAEFKKNKKHVL